MDILPNSKVDKKLFYLLGKEKSEDLTKRRIQGFKKAQEQIKEMLEERYGINRNRQNQSTRKEIPEDGNTQ